MRRTLPWVLSLALLAGGVAGCAPAGPSAAGPAPVTASRGATHPDLVEPVRRTLDAARATASRDHLSGPATMDSAEFHYHLDRWASGSNEPGQGATGDHIVYVTQHAAAEGDLVALETDTELAGTVDGASWTARSAWIQHVAGRSTVVTIGEDGFRLSFTPAHDVGDRIDLGTGLSYVLPQPQPEQHGRFREVTGGGAGTPAEVRARLTGSRASFSQEARAELDGLERSALARVDQADPPCSAEGCYGGALTDAEKELVRAHVRSDFAQRRRIVTEHAPELWDLVQGSLRWDLV